MTETAQAAEIIPPGTETGGKAATPAAPASPPSQADSTAVSRPATSSALSSAFDMDPDIFARGMGNRLTNWNTLVAGIQSDFRQDTDFHQLEKWDPKLGRKVPGRPFLAKAGAEKVVSRLGGCSRYPSFAEYERLALSGEPLPTVIIIRCEIWLGDRIISEGIGSRDSGEKAKNKKGEEYLVDGTYNKSLKMAMKSALISAVLNLGLSEIYSQDYEEVVAAQAAEGGSNTATKSRKPAPSGKPTGAMSPPTKASDSAIAGTHRAMNLAHEAARDKFITLTGDEVDIINRFLYNFAPGYTKKPSQKEMADAKGIWDKYQERLLGYNETRKAATGKAAGGPPDSPPPPSSSDNKGEKPGDSGDNFSDLDDVPF